MYATTCYTVHRQQAHDELQLQLAGRFPGTPHPLRLGRVERTTEDIILTLIKEQADRQVFPALPVMNIPLLQWIASIGKW